MRAYAAVGAVVVCLLTGGVFSTAAEGAYGGGGGWSPEDPFLISQPAHLLEISSHPEHLDKHFKLMTDIDLAEAGWTPAHMIGPNWGATFSGTFDGSGYAIRNLSYSADSTYRLGLFGCVQGIVKNLYLTDVTFVITHDAVIVGGLAGELSGGQITNCHVTYTITAGDNCQLIGGLVGNAGLGLITNCSARGTLKVGANGVRLGGLVGQCRASVVDSFASAAIEAGNQSQYIGGLSGGYEGQSGPIDRCWSDGSVRVGSGGTAGGLVGWYAQGDILNSYSMADMHAAGSAGGLVGSIRITTYGAIRNCWSSGAVSISNSGGGGLVGYAEGATIENCRSSGAVSGSDDAQSLGGLIGSTWDLTSVTNCSSTGDVTAGVSTNYLGGLIGMAANTSVRGCWSGGAVVSGGGAGTWMIGGLIGMHGTGLVEDSYSLSPVDAGPSSNYVGGLIGQANRLTLTHCFAAGEVQCDGTYAGGLIGEAQTTLLTTCFWDKEATGKTTSSGGGKGLTTAAMQTQSTFESAGWDFANTWKMYAYPGLAWQPEIGIGGELAVSLSAGETGEVEFSVFALREVTIQWTLEGVETCGWITAAAPAAGTTSGPGEATVVSLTIDSAGLAAGDYTHDLQVVGSNGETATVIIQLHVYHRLGLDSFALLSSYWAADCDFGQPCKAVDWYVDGGIGLHDLAQLVEGWLGEGIERVRAEVNEGFESGDFTALDWQMGGEAAWQTVSTGAHEGAFAARSGAIGDGQSSVLEVTLDLTGWEVDTIGFAYRPSSEAGYDFLRFYIDGVEQGSWSNVWSEYQTQTFAITPGVRTFKWVYSKDASDGAGEDCAWIDAVRVYAR